LLGYTYGSGGYYSPQSYLSFALPVEVTGQAAGWSYRVRSAVAHSASNTHDALFYPLDPALQAAATTSPPPGYSRPVVGGARSSGASFSFYAAAEHALSPQLVFGAALDLDRADYYHPTGLRLYLRHAFGPDATPVAAPPRPIRPYADF